jgi:hypothetical protein
VVRVHHYVERAYRFDALKLVAIRLTVLELVQFDSPAEGERIYIRMLFVLLGQEGFPSLEHNELLFVWHVLHGKQL